ncbi:hypothetical protein AVEN_176157-1 [Araneus ventricosus]|uniref:Uncharacterized protein n=1 Tax=Araneus ventricosus TaxID=182803 RepID=A0A4Y2Q463_ARAVE|nr:hypothetical protein AVEN_176157-1 [Araneus ventricosus]
MAVRVNYGSQDSLALSISTNNKEECVHVGALQDRPLDLEQRNLYKHTLKGGHCGYSVYLQQILSVFKASLDDLAQIADKIHEVSGCNSTVARVEPKPDQVELDAIKAKLTDLKNMVKTLSVSEYSHGRIKSRRQSLTPSRHTAGKKVEPKRLCWYHHRFGDKASKCVKPYAYPLN